MKILLSILLYFGLFTSEHYTSHEAYYFIQGGNPHGVGFEEEAKIEISDTEIEILRITRQDTINVLLLDTLPTGISSKGMIMKGRKAIFKDSPTDTCQIGYGYRNGELIFLSISDRAAAIVFTIDSRVKNSYTRP